MKTSKALKCVSFGAVRFRLVLDDLLGVVLLAVRFLRFLALVLFRFGSFLPLQTRYSYSCESFYLTFASLLVQAREFSGVSMDWPVSSATSSAKQRQHT
jgi:hypothetical protein